MKILRPFTKKETAPEVTIGRETFCPRPLTLERAIELVLLLGPYVALGEKYGPELRLALNSNGDGPRLLSTLFVVLAEEIRPVDFTRAFAILLDREPEWFREVQAVELVRALPVLDEVNDLGGLLEAVRGLMPGDNELQPS